MINYSDSEVKIILNPIKEYLSGGYPSEKAIRRLQELPDGHLLKFLRYHKLLLVYYHILYPFQDKTIYPLKEKTINRCKNLVVKNLQMQAESEKVTTAFLHNGIVVIPYKGNTFGNLFYNKQALRYSIDIDFAIDFKDLRKCQEVMTKLGYDEQKGTLDLKNPTKSRAYQLDYPWIKTNTNNQPASQVDFHIAPAHKALKLDYEFKNLDQRSKPQFNKVEHALFIIIHHGFVDLWGKLMHLIDLDKILDMLTEEERLKLFEACENLRIHKYLCVGVSLISKIFNKAHQLGPLPKVSDKTLNGMCREILNLRLGDKWSKNKKKVYYHLLLRDGIKDKLNASLSILNYLRVSKSRVI